MADASGRPGGLWLPQGAGPQRINRRALLRRGGTLAVAAAGGSLLAACDDIAEDPDGAVGDGAVAPATDEPDVAETAGGLLTVRLVSDIANLDPAFLVGQVDDAVMLCIAENLLTFDRNGEELVNELAEEFESSDDGLTHEFRLKEGIPFHGGYGEVTAEDVKFSFERIAGLTDPPIDSLYSGDWATLEEVEVTGEYTGVIRLSEPFAPLRNISLAGNAGMIISRAAWEERGEDIATQPIGSGPFEFVEWNRGEWVHLRRFDDWGGAALEWAEEPQWEEIRLLALPDDSAADVALETGEAEFGSVSHASVGRFEEDDRFEVTRQPTYDYGWIGFNVTDEVLSDINVRRALRLTLDVDSMIAAAFEDRTQRANTLLAPGLIGHWEDAPQYEPDLEAARGLFDEAGVDPQGLQLEIAIIEEPGSRIIAEIMQANMAELGIDASIRLHESGGELRDRLADVDLFYVSFSNSFDPSWATVWFTSQYIGSWNYMSWSNEEYDRLDDEAVREIDEEARHDLYVRMQEIMDEDAVALWVQYRTNHYVHPSGLDPSIVTPRYGKFRSWDHRA